MLMKLRRKLKRTVKRNNLLGLIILLWLALTIIILSFNTAGIRRDTRITEIVTKNTEQIGTNIDAIDTNISVINTNQKALIYLLEEQND